jgi:acyl carrier protein
LIGELRAFLKERLPDYMLPAAFVFLEALPLTPGGKIDRRALPPPDRTRPEADSTFVAPTNAVEELIAGIWTEVLGVERVGIYDNFFTLGGHSLLVAQILFRLHDAFQIELPMRTFFEQPTIAELAVTIEEILTEEIAYLSDEEALDLMEEEPYRDVMQ